MPQPDATDIRTHWIAGAPHPTPVRGCFDAPALVIRTGFARGREAINGERPRPCRWRPFRISYFPAGTEYLHATEIAADWLRLDLAPDTLADLGAPAIGAAPRAGDGAPLADAVTALRAVCAAAVTPDPLRLAVCTEALAAQALRALGHGHAVERWHLPPPALGRVLDFVEASLERTIRLGELAALAGVSRYHFAKAFHADTGVAPYAYVLSRRTARARALLAAGGMPLAEIALAAGFAGQSHLNRVFKRETGITPGAYRRWRRVYSISSARL